MTIFLRLWLASSLVATSALAAVADAPTSAYSPVCFMQTETGQIINLSHLCGSSEQTVSSPQAQPAAVPQQRRGRGAARR